MSSDTVVANILQFTTNTLFPGTMYTFEVAAVNNNGTGPYTSLQVSTSNPTGECGTVLLQLFVSLCCFLFFELN